MRGPFTARRLLGVAAFALLLLPCAQAKLAPERWGLLSEEERHQMTRAERYVDQKDYKSALSEYELFLQLHGKSDAASYAQFMFAECTRRLGKVNTAIDEFRNVIDYFPDSIDAGTAQYSIGVCLVQGGDAEKAAVAFEKVVEKWPKEDFGAQARNELCTIYWRLGQVEKWAPHMDYLATGDYKDTLRLRITSQRRLFLHRIALNQIPDAYDLIVKTHPKDPVMTFAEWASAALRGDALQNAYGDKVVKNLPAIATGVVAFIAKNPGDPAQKSDMDLRCARILAASGVTDKAIASYTALLKRDAGNDRLRSEYATYLRSLGRYEDARLAYRELKDPYVADRETAETYREENNRKRAIEVYQGMLAKFPDKVGDIQWRMAELLQLSGKYTEAIASYQQSQKDPQALFRVAECQGSMKQYDTAIQTLVGVMNFFKSAAPEAQYRIAGYQAAKGDKNAAIRTLKTVCKVYLNTPWAGHAHQDLSLKYGVEVTLGGAAKKDDE